ncbi:hypothetical protein [Streptomyces sp. NBRC 13847]|uniref:hypothetical protein n=1 Tax=Streptomyces sp. NBRC 13847 TaxID=3030991 RepID=UPI0025571B5D|nr:hypothetical protein [Streptomyces sp. NBRC 13847]
MTVSTCIYCGARREDPAASSCPNCGMPPDGVVPPAAAPPAWAPARHGYVRIGATALPLWLLWLVAGLLVAGGVTAYLLTGTSSEPSYQADDPVPAGTPSAEPFSPSAPPTDTYAPVVPDTSLPTVGDTPTAPASSPSAEDASATVREYYQDINARDFTAAWDLGGKNIGGSSFSTWSSGFASTSYIALTAVNADSAGRVDAVLHATQSDGSVRVYHGTYTVSDGVIVSADISQD